MHRSTMQLLLQDMLAQPENCRACSEFIQSEVIQLPCGCPCLLKGIVWLGKHSISCTEY